MTPGLTVDAPASPALGGDRSPVAAEAGTTSHPGRIEVADRVFRKAAQQAASEAIGVDHGDVSIQIGAARSALAVRVESPFPVPRLDDSEAIRAATPIVDAARNIQRDLHDRLTTLFGRDVSRVDLTITGATTPKRRRVR